MDRARSSNKGLRILHYLLDFFVYSNFFISGCAILMVWQTTHFLLQDEPDIHLTWFIFFATLSSYSFHWWLTYQPLIPSERIAWINRHKNLHLILFFIGITGSAVFFFYLFNYWKWLAPAAIATFLYSAPKIPHPYFRALRKWALGKTIFLALLWMYVTTVLPLIVNGREWTLAFTLFSISRFFMIYAICILFDYRDREDDKAAGIRSLITYLSGKGVTSLFILSLIVNAVATLWLIRYDYSIFNISLLLLPGAISAVVYSYARHYFRDMFYYLFLDGLMALSALLMWVLR